MFRIDQVPDQIAFSPAPAKIVLLHGPFPDLMLLLRLHLNDLEILYGPGVFRQTRREGKRLKRFGRIRTSGIPCRIDCIPGIFVLPGRTRDLFRQLEKAAFSKFLEIVCTGANLQFASRIDETEVAAHQRAELGLVYVGIFVQGLLNPF